MSLYDKTPEIEGYWAHKDGKPISENPYPGDIKFEFWNRGWTERHIEVFAEKLGK